MSSQPVDESKLTPQELRLYKLYGKLPSKNEVLSHKLQERKYFDSGDYAMNQAGIKLNNKVSDRHLNPEEILRINRSSISGSAGVGPGGVVHGNTGSANHLKRRSSLENEVRMSPEDIAAAAAKSKSNN